MIKFFTLPPYTISYPFVLINANRPEEGLRYIRKHHRVIREVIIDSGVEIFRNPSIKEYPNNIFSKLVALYKKVKMYVDNVYVVCPDYPDDYRPKQLWLDGKDNIERTIDNVVVCLYVYSDVNWLLPIQGHYRNPKSILKCIDAYWAIGAWNRVKIAGIANLCTENDIGIIRDTIKLARMHIPEDIKLHGFGINLKAIRYVHRYLDSFDSMAWTRPVSRRLRKNYSARTIREKEEYFRAWIRRLHSILSVSDITKFLLTKGSKYA